MGTDNIDQGLLLIGVTNTVLFDGQGAIELLFLNLATGGEVTMPVSEQQAEYLISCVGEFGAEQHNHEEPASAPNQTENSSQVEVSAWNASEKTPQL